ncbi:hypothetical protein N7462_005471 [Penicillium macrosclerotiorum]|uniref:uncharacterized protein n=1 Tax=Penicillium macrosclerotiorum TaxID=303699 RepID=UPI0025475684|nr:uncharacterized protein N7462_005471 [Penicillium macrosclerotiorum]KAJ5682306.1 hypothetical protein N7462_005471 [Penicillium macrosclerotiorum]
MGPAEAASSPAFPALDPIIMDDEMESAFRNANMDFLDPTNLDMPSEAAGGTLTTYSPESPTPAPVPPPNLPNVIKTNTP